MGGQPSKQETDNTWSIQATDVNGNPIGEPITGTDNATTNHH